MRRLLFTLVFALPLAAASAPSLLDILSDELQRNFTILKQKGDPAPYYMDYTVTDEESQSFRRRSAPSIPARRTICAIWMSRCASARLSWITTIRLTGKKDSSRSGELLPLDDVPDAIRRRLWLDTDRTYKLAAPRLIEIKSNQQVKVKDADGSADFSSEPPAVYQEPPPPLGNLDEQWAQRARKWSAAVADFPDVLYSNVSLSAERISKYMVSTDGTRLLHGRDFVNLSIVARGKATDGMDLVALGGFPGGRPGALAASGGD